MPHIIFIPAVLSRDESWGLQLWPNLHPPPPFLLYVALEMCKAVTDGGPR